MRDMTARDRRFVVPTWAESSRYGRMPRSARYQLIDRILDSGARVLCMTTDGDTVHAWGCAQSDVLHYVYVPPELRGEGWAYRLILSLFDGAYPKRIVVSHPWPRQSSRFLFDPYALPTEKAA